MSLLEIKNLTVAFDTKVGLIKAVDGIDIIVDSREVLAVVGERAKEGEHAHGHKQGGTYEDWPPQRPALPGTSLGYDSTCSAIQVRRLSHASSSVRRGPQNMSPIARYASLDARPTLALPHRLNRCLAPCPACRRGRQLS